VIDCTGPDGNLLRVRNELVGELLRARPITKGEAWEIVAVPDIHRQVWNVARLLADEHWVGGEGL
jgi:uncharacterized NAD(P)/FAD-binding protein YdhS